ncbi:MAG: 50S ribosomal protein L13 [Thaumarchaeota archaeon]|nr:50S ribosomal protein L13 [Nitrososphaerota archaeon]MCZ6725016.1 50S ribosomal protein L13 [Nitrososphaerota archaeon]
MDKEKSGKLIVTDAEGKIAGRLASRVAKFLLSGSRVIVLNSEKALISGNKKSILNEQRLSLEIGSIINPKHGPIHPRKPDRILSRMVRGMLPRTKTKGIDAYKRLRVYIGVPSEYSSQARQEIEDAKPKRAKAYYTEVGWVAQEIGWKGTD